MENILADPTKFERLGRTSSCDTPVASILDCTYVYLNISELIRRRPKFSIKHLAFRFNLN